MQIKLGNLKLKDINIPANVLNIIEGEISELRRRVKKESVIPLYYIMVSKEGRTQLIPNLGEVPTHLHKSLINPMLKFFDTEYLLLFCESSVLIDGVQRDAEEWEKIYAKYGSLDNHPNKKDLVQAMVFTKNCKHIGATFIAKKSSKKGTRTFGELAWSTQRGIETDCNLEGFFN